MYLPRIEKTLVFIGIKVAFAKIVMHKNWEQPFMVTLLFLVNLKQENQMSTLESEKWKKKTPLFNEKKYFKFDKMKWIKVLSVEWWICMILCIWL